MIEGGQIWGSGSGGVTSLNLLMGALTLVGGTNVTITPSGDTIRIDAVAGGAGIASINASTIGAQTLISSDTDILTVDTNIGTGVTTFSLITGTAANNLLQLNASAQLPAVDIGTLGLVDNPFTEAASALNTALSDIQSEIDSIIAGSVTTVFGRGGPAIVAQSGDYTFSQISGINAANKGGTGIGSYTPGDLIVALNNTTLMTLAAPPVGRVLISNGAGVLPSYSTTPSVGDITLYNLTSQIILGVTNTLTFTMATQTSPHVFTLPNADSNPVKPRTLTAGSAVQFIDNTGLQNLMVVIDQILTSFSAAAGTVSNADTIVTAINKIVGNIALLVPSVQQIVANYQMLITDGIIEVEANNLTITLPDATTVPTGRSNIYYVNNGNVTGTSVVPEGGQFINDSLTTWSINAPYTGAGYYSNGTGWRTI